MKAKGRLFVLLLAALVGPSLALWSCGGELPGPKVCSTRSGGCSKGMECVLGRCRRDGTMPVSLKAPRLTFAPTDAAWVHGRRVQAAAAWGDALWLGKRGEESAWLMMRFGVTLPEEARVQRAVLRFDPLPGCPLRPGRMALGVAHVLSDWRVAELGRAWPKLGVPMAAGEVAVTPAKPLLLDVTELVRAWRTHRKRYYGLALSAAGQSETGGCYTTGASWGEGPRLEIYLSPEEVDAGSDASTDADLAGDAGDAGGDAAEGGGDGR